jgi:predicted MFS family arabinose efflux permease
MPWAIIAAACFGMFAASSSGTTRAPFLIEMAQDLETSVPLIANLMAATSVAWGISSLLAGAWSDRWGRRPFLIGGPLGIALCMVGVAGAGSYHWVAVWATGGGAFAGAFTGVVMTEVASRTQDRQRGRALGFAMGGQSLTLLVGVPGAALLGTWVGWRGVNLALALLLVVAATAMFATTLRPQAGERGGGGARGSFRSALSPRLLRLLAMGTAERTCFGLTAVYFATFLQTTYGLSLGQVALPLAIFACGNIAGTMLGGQLADRLADRLRTFAGALGLAAVLALPLFLWTPALPVSVALGFLHGIAIAAARPALMAALAQVPDEVRGAVLGLNVTAASLGWLSAAALGGIIIASGGFHGFGPLSFLLGAAGVGLALVGQRRHR